MTNISEIAKKLSERITNTETRQRSRTAEEYQRFLYAIEYILTDIWKVSYIHPEAECSIHKHNNYYSSNSRYRNPNLTYRMTMNAFDGLQLLNLIVVTKDGYYDRTKMQGGLTRYRAREELLEMLNEIPEHPAIHLKPNLDTETILLRNEIDGRKVLVDYEEDAFTEKARNNLKTINQCFTRHWVDLRILDSFIMHHGFSTYGELEEAMRRAFYERFHRDIGVSKELVVKHKSNIPIDKDELATPSFDDIINAENDYSQWRDRDDMWMSRILHKNSLDLI